MRCRNTILVVGIEVKERIAQVYPHHLYMPRAIIKTKATFTGTLHGGHWWMSAVVAGMIFKFVATWGVQTISHATTASVTRCPREAPGGFLLQSKLKVTVEWLNL